MAEGARWNSLNSLGVESIAPRTGSYSTTHVLRCLCSVFSANQMPLLLRMGQLDKSQMIWAKHLYLEYFPPLLHENMSFQFFDIEKKLLSTSRSPRMYKKISLISVLSKKSPPYICHFHSPSGSRRKVAKALNHLPAAISWLSSPFKEP